MSIGKYYYSINDAKSSSSEIKEFMKIIEETEIKDLKSIDPEADIDVISSICRGLRVFTSDSLFYLVYVVDDMYKSIVMFNIDDGFIHLNIFCSNEKGCGEKLLGLLKEIATKNSLGIRVELPFSHNHDEIFDKSVLEKNKLYNYYIKNGFTLEHEFIEGKFPIKLVFNQSAFKSKKSKSKKSKSNSR